VFELEEETNQYEKELQEFADKYNKLEEKNKFCRLEEI